MTRLSIDLETFSSVNLKTAGVYKYAESPDFEILILAYQIDNDPVKVLDLSVDEIPQVVVDALYHDGVQKYAYNAAFEIACLNSHMEKHMVPVPLWMEPTQWTCTMAKAAMLGLPFGLDLVSRVLGLTEKKDPRGSALIKYFSVPCKPTKANGMRTRNLSMHDPQAWNDYLEYCRRDVIVERAIADKIAFFEAPDFEKPLYALDIEINQRGVQIDQQLVRNAIQIGSDFIDGLYKEADRIAGKFHTGVRMGPSQPGVNPKSGPQLKKWLSEEHDINLADVKKDTIAEVLKGMPEGDAKRMLEIRQMVSKTSIKKYDSLLRSVCADGRVRGLMQYYGANRTGRWAGRLAQVQNFPRNVMKYLEDAREYAKAGDLDTLELLFGNVPYVLSQLTRTALVARPGYKLIASDFAAIEARVIAWLAGEQWRIDAFLQGLDIYKESYSRMFDVDYNEVTKDNRQTGKVAELALGYQGAVGALTTMDAKKILNPDDMPEIVRNWREASPNIVQLWYRMNDAAIKCVETKQPVTVGYVSFKMVKNILCMVLPSGRMLCYFRPRIEKNKFGMDCVSYEGMDQKTKQWGRTQTYGGMLVENATQAIARDLLAYKMVDIANRGYEMVFHVHDEVVIEVPNINSAAVEIINTAMGRPVPWAEGLPLKAESFETFFYRKGE